MRRLSAVLLSFALGWCVNLPAQQGARSVPAEPANLGVLKTKLQQYHDCKARTCYTPSMEHQADVAITFLRRRVAHAGASEKLAVVFDIDETALANWQEEQEDDFGYIPKDSIAWELTAQAPAIPGTLRVYREAIQRGVAVFFITGRNDGSVAGQSDLRAATEQNLRSAGYTTWAGLSTRGAHPAGQTTTQYKSGERAKIVAQGYRIILNMGDQFSDLNGAPQAELSVKLPNPFYYIP